MRRVRTAAAVAILLAFTAACAPTSSGEPSSKRPESTRAAPQRPAEARVVAGDRYTTIIGADGERIRLLGRFEFDARSTDGRLLYLIEHRPPPGSENYRVRVYDFAAAELRPEPVADKRNLETDMTGRPMARTTSADHVWVFTLYRSARHAFVHALNVDHAFALCLDLPRGAGRGSGDWTLEVSADGATLHAVAGAAADRADFDLRDLPAD